MAVYFTDNVRDLSNSDGYQFEFVCERCGNGVRSPYQRDNVETGKKLLRGIGSVLGGKMAQIGHATHYLDRVTNSKAKDAAMDAAVQSCKHHFTQCRGCSDWVCTEVCWNAEIGQCAKCSPSVAEELSRAQAAAQVAQLRQRTQEVDWTRGLDLAARTPVACPQCTARVAPGKFCASCGAQLSATDCCRSCSEPMYPGARFCSTCGTGAW